VRDIIWTIIVVWLIWKVFEAFKTLSKPKTTTQRVYTNQTNSYTNKKDGEVKIEATNTTSKPHFKSGHGEYVDYEEVN
jgi:uncharacterized protein YxeA